MNINKKDKQKLEQVRLHAASRSAKISGALGVIAIIAIVLYYALSTYIPYAKHKPLIAVKNVMLRIAVAENRYYQENKQFAPEEVLFKTDQNSLEFNGYKIQIDIKPDLSNYKITAEQLDSANIQYPNCNKLVVTPRKYFSYDTFGEISTGCW